MELRTVYDIAETGYTNWWFPAMGLVLVAAFGFLISIERWLAPAFLRPMLRYLTGFGLLWTVLAVWLTLPPHLRLKAALRTERCMITEGEVTNYEPLPASGKGSESFVVSGVRFTYSDYQMSPGFHQTRLAKSVIHDGRYVRIHHVDNDIARLEVAADTAGAEK